MYVYDASMMSIPIDHSNPALESGHKTTLVRLGGNLPGGHTSN